MAVVSTSPEEDLEQEEEEEDLIQTTTTTRLSSSSSSLRRRRPPPPTDVDDTDDQISTTTDSSSGITTNNSDEEINQIIQGEEDDHHHHQKLKSIPPPPPPPLTNGEEEETTTSGGERIGNDEQKEANFAFKYAYRPSAPAHRRIKESPLSSDAIFRQSHAGLLNLCIVVLVAVNSRLIIENLMKYGFLMGSGFWFSSHSLRDWPLFMCCLSLPIFPLGAFMVEKLAQNKLASEPVVVSLHVIISTSAIFYPVFMILRFESAVASGIALMLFACIVWLKLVSYAHASYDIRVLIKSGEKGQMLSDSPDMDNSYSVNIKKLAYFMVAPTLCYQPSYPRTTCIRKGWVIRQLIKLVIFTGLMGFIIEQYINPIVQNSQHPLKGDLLNAVERVLKLSVPVLYVWLCMFYCFFHLWLNILAELLRFGDREFYKDWWNAKTVEEYWRMWNMPVHKWMVRHIYFPCLRNGLPKVNVVVASPFYLNTVLLALCNKSFIYWLLGWLIRTVHMTCPMYGSSYFFSAKQDILVDGAAVLISFFISAIFHELCIAVPCHIFKFWAFMGIMLQIPLVLLTNYLQNKFRNTMVGNMIFWLCFSILGQPMSILLYYHDLMNQRARTE